MKKSLFAIVALAAIQISFPLFASVNELRFEGLVKSNIELESGKVFNSSEPQELVVIEPSQNQSSVPSMYGCSNDYECIRAHDSHWMQVKALIVTMPYVIGTEASMAGLEWTFSLGSPNTLKYPKKVQVYAVYNGSESLQTTESLSYTGGETVTVLFSKPLDPSAEYRFVFSDSQDSWGHTAIEHFNPLFLK